MNGIALFTLFLATTAQLSGELGPNDIRYGWTMEKDRSISYIVQPTPQTLTKMSTTGSEITAPIPDFLQGVVKQIVFRVGSAEVEQIPTELELRNMKSTLPPSNAMNNFGSTSLSSLNDPRHTTVAIDPVRGNVSPMSISGTTRISDTELDASQPPLLAQTYPNNSSSRGSFSSASTYDPTRSGFSTPSGIPVSNTSALSQNNPYTFTNNGSFVGPTLPPTTPSSTYSATTFPATSSAPLTGNPITVVGSPTTSSIGSSSNYNMNQPLASGNFGNPNNYTYGSVPSLNFNSSSYPNQSSYASSNYPNPTTGTGGSFNYTQVASNTPVGGNYPYPNSSASNINNTGFNPMNPTGATNGGYGSMPPYANPNVNPNATNFPSMNPAATSMIPNVASNPMTTSTVARPQEFSGKSSYLDEAALRREIESASSPNFLMALFLLASLVGNVYLFLLINQLLQRYRMLQASSRGSTSLAI